MATDVSCIVFEIRRGGGGRSGGGVGTRLPFCCFFLLFVAFSCFLLPFVAFVTPACFSSRRRPLMKIRGTRGVFFSFFFSSLCWVRQQGQTMFGSGGGSEKEKTCGWKSRGRLCPTRCNLRMSNTDRQGSKIVLLGRRKLRTRLFIQRQRDLHASEIRAPSYI